jgi:hypothetical protein
MAIEETYGFGILNEGLAIGIAKNVAIKATSSTCRPALCSSRGSDTASAQVIRA